MARANTREREKGRATYVGDLDLVAFLEVAGERGDELVGGDVPDGVSV